MTTPPSFETIARESRRYGIVSDAWAFLRNTKKWWLLPMLVVMGALGVLLLLSSTGVGPFIYTLF